MYSQRWQLCRVGQHSEKGVYVCVINGRAEQAHYSDIRKKPVIITALSLVLDQCVLLQINVGRLPASADGLKNAFFRPGRLDTFLSVPLLNKALDL